MMPENRRDPPHGRSWGITRQHKIDRLLGGCQKREWKECGLKNEGATDKQFHRLSVLESGTDKQKAA